MFTIRASALVLNFAVVITGQPPDGEMPVEVGDASSPAASTTEQLAPPPPANADLSALSNLSNLSHLSNLAALSKDEPKDPLRVRKFDAPPKLEKIDGFGLYQYVFCPG